MPLYEYECKRCGHRFERIQSYSAEDVKECPVCQGEVERLISAPAIRFKGSGFYSTDYGAKPSAKSGSGTSTEKAAADGAKPSSENSGSDKSSAEKSSSEKSNSEKSSTEKSAPAKVEAAKRSSE